jgi:hypothetical protein
MPAEEQTYREDIEQKFDRFDREVRRSLLSIGAHTRSGKPRGEEAAAKRSGPSD